MRWCARLARVQRALKVPHGAGSPPLPIKRLPACAEHTLTLILQLHVVLRAVILTVARPPGHVLQDGDRAGQGQVPQVALAPDDSTANKTEAVPQNNQIGQGKSKPVLEQIRGAGVEHHALNIHDRGVGSVHRQRDQRKHP